MTEVKAVVCDIDGTLTDYDRRVCLDAIAALRKVEGNGIPVLLASGNVLPVMYGIGGLMGFTGPLVAENGGLIFWKREVRKLADPELPRKALDYLSTKMEVSRILSDRWRETEVGLSSDVDVEKVRRLLKDWDVRVESTGFAHHIISKEVSKMTGVEAALKWMGVKPENAAAFGDSENDVSMIGGCGVGVALANACQAAKDVADIVTEKAHGDGVVEGLEELRLI